MPTTTGSTASRWLRVGGQLDRDVLAGAGHELARLPEVVLHVAGALHRVGVDLALELLEELVVALADDVGEHVEPPAVRHADDGAVEVGVGGRLEDGVEDRDGRLGALEPEPLLAHVLGGEELLERLRRVEALEDVALVVERRAPATRPPPAPGSSAAPPGPGCACTRCRSCGSRRRAARGGCRRAPCARGRRARR